MSRWLERALHYGVVPDVNSANSVNSAQEEPKKPSIGTNGTIGNWQEEKNEEARHIFQERAAIYEYDTGHSRKEAERLGFQDLLADYVREHYPAIYDYLWRLTQGEMLQ